MGKADKAKLTREKVLAAVDRLEATVSEWERSEEPELFTLYNGRTVRALSTSIENVASMLFELCDTLKIEQEAWPLVLAVDRFDEAMTEFVERFQSAPADTPPNGTRGLWAAYKDLLHARVSPENKRPDPLTQLKAQGVSYTQMAKMYRWYLPDGRPDVEKVQEELNRPGTHYNPETWIHPRYKAFWDDIEQRWNQRVELFRERGKAEEDARRGRKKTRAPETLEELLALPNITGQQIAKMLKISEEDVFARARELGISLEENTSTYATYREAQVAAHERRKQRIERSMALNNLDTYPDLDSFEARVMAMADDGVVVQDIAEALRDAYPGITYQDVGRAINQAKSAQTAESVASQSADRG